MPNNQVKPKQKRFNKKYDWDKWFSQKRTLLKSGKHYKVTSVSMAGQIRMEAMRRKISISIKHIEGVGIQLEVVN